MAELPAISIIGPGKVGTALGVLCARAGWPLRAVAGRDLAKARAGTRAIALALRESLVRRASHPAPRSGSRLARLADLPLSPVEAARAGELVLLTVPDDAIGPLCRRLADAGAFRKGAIVAHCSGALGSDVLAPARDCGCHVGSMHPLQTFPTVEAALGKLPGSYFFIEGDPPVARTLSRLAVAVGGIPIRIAPQAKTLYHAAACVASNYLVTLMDAALQVGSAAGIAPAKLLRALEPLVRATVDNVFALGPARALTGPIARGDAQTVRRHQKALRRANPRLAALYAILARWTEDLAKRG